MTSNNDSKTFDMEKFQPCKEFHFEWPVNGDYPEAQLLDAHTGKVCMEIHWLFRKLLGLSSWIITVIITNAKFLK
ncbi:hypothetical protein ZIOFF_039104 [Zingiber officinale]|uniref:Uncharacterized protein n=1 Tax=Zingiber officinale TaxID=94328 RepID=A0A8J5G0P1_ZINOF|nr:hypothetical protein ZIOFF_039104 [Zingiber officinale]